MQLAAALDELGEAAPPVMFDVAELPQEGEAAPPPPPASPPKQEKGGKGGKGKKGGSGAKAKPVGPDPAMMVEIRIETTPTLTTRVATHAGLCEALENVRAAGRYHREGNPTGNPTGTPTGDGGSNGSYDGSYCSTDFSPISPARS